MDALQTTTTRRREFRHGHCILHVITLLVDKVTTVSENKQFTLSIFLDLSKAFDTIDHNNLLQKLKHYGVRSIPLNWFKGHLLGRTQQTEYCGAVNINNVASLPQGSLLDLLLFILYVNDFTRYLKYSCTMAFADNTSKLISGKTLETLYKKGNEELNNIDNWLIPNKLCVVEWLKRRAHDQHVLGSNPLAPFCCVFGKKTFPCLVALASSSKFQSYLY